MEPCAAVRWQNVLHWAGERDSGRIFNVQFVCLAGYYRVVVAINYLRFYCSPTIIPLILIGLSLSRIFENQNFGSPIIGCFIKKKSDHFNNISLLFLTKLGTYNHH